MSKENSDFFALRSALKRERQRNKELIKELEIQKEKEAEFSAEKKALLERFLTFKTSLDEANAKLSEDRCTAKRQIEALEAAKRERDELSQTVAYLKGDGLWELVEGNEEIKKKVICGYLESLPRGITLIGSYGHTALTPVHKPKNLADAKRIAEKIIKF